MQFNPNIWNMILVAGVPTPLKMMEFVSWDDEIPNMMGKSFKIPWFQSPPTSYVLPLLTIINHINHY